MSRYVYILEYNDGHSPHSMFGSHVMRSRDYHKIRSRCRLLSRDNAYGGTCLIYRAKVEATEYEIAFNFCFGLEKKGDKWCAGNIECDYIGIYSHDRAAGTNNEFYAYWTLGRDAVTRHSMYVVTPAE